MSYKNHESLKSLYISQLDSNVQNEIKNLLIIFYKYELDLTEKEISSELELAMNSRVSDLGDTIDIKTLSLI